MQKNTYSLLNSLKRLNHKSHKALQCSLHKHMPVTCGKKGAQQMAENVQHKELPKEMTKYVQSVVGTFLCYARALDYAMLTALDNIGMTQANPTERTLDEVQQLIDYAATHPNTTA